MQIIMVQGFHEYRPRTGVTKIDNCRPGFYLHNEDAIFLAEILEKALIGEKLELHEKNFLRFYCFSIDEEIKNNGEKQD